MSGFFVNDIMSKLSGLVPHITPGGGVAVALCGRREAQLMGVGWAGADLLCGNWRGGRLAQSHCFPSCCGGWQSV